MQFILGILSFFPSKVNYWKVHIEAQLAAVPFHLRTTRVRKFNSTKGDSKSNLIKVEWNLSEAHICILPNNVSLNNRRREWQELLGGKFGLFCSTTGIFVAQGPFYSNAAQPVKQCSQPAKFVAHLKLFIQPQCLKWEKDINIRQKIAFKWEIGDRWSAALSLILKMRLAKGQEVRGSHIK